ncbi:MAG: hypothetical protein P8Y58_03765 [Novosphingobium sp.]
MSGAARALCVARLLSAAGKRDGALAEKLSDALPLSEGKPDWSHPAA